LTTGLWTRGFGGGGGGCGFGVVAGGGSDHMQKIGSIRSINPYNPFLGMWVAVSRRAKGREGRLHPEEALTREQAIRFYTINNARLLFLEDRIGSLDVQSAAISVVPLMTDNKWSSTVKVEGYTPKEDEDMNPYVNAVGPGYFATMGQALLAGREFTMRDAAGAPKVAVINETMAKMFFPGRDPIGRHMKFGSGSSPLNIEIIGVVKDSKHQGVKEEVRPFVYMPYTQDPTVGRITYYIRTQQDPAAIAAAICSTVAQLDANLPVVGLRSLELQIEMSISGDRLLAFLTVAFGILAALLAAMGIYGLLAYTVTQRTREIGVRMALGAEPRHVRRMILGDVTRLAGIGIVAGLPLAYGISRLTNSLLYNVKSFDVPSFMVALLALVLVASVAGYAPAWRATPRRSN